MPAPQVSKPLTVKQPPSTRPCSTLNPFTAVSLESERERIVERLSAHYAEDHLSTQELEERFERAYRARTVEDLRAVVADLPGLTAPVRVPVPVPRAPRVPAQPKGVVGERRYLAVMSNFRKSGNWTPSRATAVKAVMASVHIDLRDATFVDAEIDFDITAIMTEVRIIVPPGVQVNCDGWAFMGEFEGRSDSGLDPDAPRVNVRGSALMATVNVETRLPGESARAARRRERLERGQA